VAIGDAVAKDVERPDWISRNHTRPVKETVDRRGRIQNLPPAEQGGQCRGYKINLPASVHLHCCCASTANEDGRLSIRILLIRRVYITSHSFSIKSFILNPKEITSKPLFIAFHLVATSLLLF
jgi:hypothetical protein